MDGLFDMFVVFVRQPWLALAPAIAFAALARFSGRSGLWLVAIVWGFYGLYEAGVQARLLCSGDCNIRADLLFIAPALVLLSLIGIGSLIGPRPHDGSRYRSPRG